MTLRTLLILAFLAQQLVLPVLSAQTSSHCEARTAGTEAAAASCCVLPQHADGGDGFATNGNGEAHGGCTCIASLCACREGHHQSDPVAPERQNRSVDQLVPMLALPSLTSAALPRGSGEMRPSEQIRFDAPCDRLRAILCIWRT